MKILQLCKKFPYPLKDGESVAVHQMSKSLVDAGCEVHLLAMNTSRHYVNVSESIFPDSDHYSEIHTVEVDNGIYLLDAVKNFFSKDSYHISRFVSEAFHARLKDILQNNSFDIIQLETLYLAPYLKTIKENSHALIVMRAHNIEHEIWERIADQIQFIPKKLYLSYLSNKLRKFEINSLNNYDFLVAITERDMIKFKSLGYKNGCISAPVSFDTREYLPDYAAFERPISLCFLGSLDWMPNIEGLKWFFGQVWPSIHQHFPKIEFHFAGRNASTDLANINLPNVFYHGNVEEAKSFINQYSIMVVPLFAASGIRVKILEAMALGRVVISTSIGLEGISAKHNKEIFIANKASEFLETIRYCHQFEKEYQQMGRNACKFVREQFDSQLEARKLVDAYHSTLQLHSEGTGSM